MEIIKKNNSIEYIDVAKEYKKIIILFLKKVEKLSSKERGVIISFLDFANKPSFYTEKG